MTDDLRFRFVLPKPPEGPLVEMSAEEMEKLLVKRAETDKDPVEGLWQLARFYQQSKNYEKGLACLRQILSRMPDAEGKARTILGLGQMMESVGDYKAAVMYYKEALALEPSQTDVWYFISNNLGFSLIQLSQFSEGATWCRRAIETNPNRANAYKNLGMALSGQGDFQGAATCFVAATQVDAADPRAFKLLEELLQHHPELEFEFRDRVDCCREAVQAVAKKAAQLKPVVYKGWRKQLILMRENIRRFFRRKA